MDQFLPNLRGRFTLADRPKLGESSLINQDFVVVRKYQAVAMAQEGLEYWGVRLRILGDGANFQQVHDVVTTSMRRNDVASTSFRRHMPTRFSINQYQIITFLILKSDIIENSRIELRGIVLPAPSNQIKVTFIIILPFNLVHL